MILFESKNPKCPKCFSKINIYYGEIYSHKLYSNNNKVKTIKFMDSKIIKINDKRVKMIYIDKGAIHLSYNNYSNRIRMNILNVFNKQHSYYSKHNYNKKISKNGIWIKCTKCKYVNCINTIELNDFLNK
jgi:DNA-directed RNA polymerase subunit M/transcription elongation factor TFIIS